MISGMKAFCLFVLSVLLTGCLNNPTTNATSDRDETTSSINFNADLSLNTSTELFITAVSHVFTVLEIRGDTARLEIRSDPIVVELVKGTERPVDVDNDGVADMFLTINALGDSTVSLDFEIPEAKVSYSEEQASPVWGVKPGTVIPSGTTYLLSDLPKAYTFQLPPPRSRCDVDDGHYSADSYNDALEQNNGGTRVEINGAWLILVDVFRVILYREMAV